MEIRVGSPCDLEAVREIWAHCFGDDSFADWFFSRLYDPMYLRVLTVDGVVVSMAFCYPKEIVSETAHYKAWYLYGIGTTPTARGKGYARDLIESCIAEASAQGIDFCFLIPAEESLFSYYKRLGFSKVWTRNSISCDASESQLQLETRAVIPDDIPNLNRFYEEAFPSRVCRNSNDWALIVEEFRLSQGDAVLLYENNHPIGYALFYEKDAVLHIRELAVCRGINRSEVCHALCKTKRWELSDYGTEHPFAMAYPLSKHAMIQDNIYCDLLYN